MSEADKKIIWKQRVSEKAYTMVKASLNLQKIGVTGGGGGGGGGGGVRG